MKPSFAILFSDEESLDKDGLRTNVQIIHPKYASKNMEFNTLDKGTATLHTYFFGTPKCDRTFDMFYRFLKLDFCLKNFKGLDNSIFKLSQNTELSVSSKKLYTSNIYWWKY